MRRFFILFVLAYLLVRYDMKETRQSFTDEEIKTILKKENYSKTNQMHENSRQ